MITHISTYLLRTLKIYEEHDVLNNQLTLFSKLFLLTIESREAYVKREKLLRCLTLCQPEVQMTFAGSKCGSHIPRRCPRLSSKYGILHMRVAMAAGYTFGK